MLQKVREQRPSYNNSGRIASSITVSSLKLLYYQLFALCYTFAGSFAHTAAVNSSWTRSHIASLWHLAVTEDGKEKETKDKEASTARDLSRRRCRGRLVLVYPPCGTEELQAIPLNREERSNGRRIVISIGQFRPEKDHSLQIRCEEHCDRLVHLSL
jgi:alpha-1,2-mannosyltransferase